MDTQPKRKLYPNQEFNRRFKSITRVNDRNTECRDAIIDACKAAGIKCNTHIFYNWLGGFTKMPEYARRIVFPVLENYEQEKEEV